MGDGGSRSLGVIGADTSVLVRYLVGTPALATFDRGQGRYGIATREP